MRDSFIHLCGPHQKWASYGYAYYEDQTRPVDKNCENLEVVKHNREDPWQNDSDQILITRDRVIFWGNTGKIFSLSLLVHCLWKNNNANKKGHYYQNGIRCILGEQEIVKHVSLIGKSHGTGNTKQNFEWTCHQSCKEQWKSEVLFGWAFSISLHGSLSVYEELGDANHLGDCRAIGQNSESKSNKGVEHLEGKEHVGNLGSVHD